MKWGDIVIHTIAGLVRIQDIKEIECEENKVRCYVFEKEGAVFEVPVRNNENSILRRPISSEKVQRIWGILKSKGEFKTDGKLPRPHKLYRNLPEDVLEKAKLLRDLKKTQKVRAKKGLKPTQTLTKTVRKLQEKLVEEISFVQKIGEDKIRHKIEEIIG